MAQRHGGVSVEASVGGKLAQIGSRLMTALPRKWQTIFSRLLAGQAQESKQDGASTEAPTAKLPVRSNLRKTNHRLSAPLTVQVYLGHCSSY